MKRGWLLVLLSAWLCPITVLAGKNAGGALIVHTNDSYTYSTGTACTSEYAVPASCEEATTRSDKSEGTVIWLLAAFDSTATPGVTVVYFGVDYDDANLDPGAAYKLCGPAGSLEVPDNDWPYAGRGNSVAFGSAVTGESLFPFYVLRIDGGAEGSYFSTAVNPTGSYAAFVDDSDPPELDEVTRFGMVRWFAAGSNTCPVAGGEEEGGGDGGVDDGGGTDQGEQEGSPDGDGDHNWVPNCLLVRLRDDLPMPPLGPVSTLGIPSIDGIASEIGLVEAQRLLRHRDSVCARFPVGSHLTLIRHSSCCTKPPSIPLLDVGTPREA